MKENFNIAKELIRLPDCPGVYIMHSADDEVIYVGKSKSLKNRVRSYFNPSADTVKHRNLVPKIAWFEYIVTDNELEALLLESTLIKKYRPQYNVLLKDNKSYPYIKLTNEEFPRVIITREFKKDGAKYYGPYPVGFSVYEVLEVIKIVFRPCLCQKKVAAQSKRACLNYHIGVCDAPCIGKITKEQYAEKIDDIIEFLGGKRQVVLKKLENEMLEASENLEFEKAASLRDKIFAVKRLADKQKLDKTSNDTRDVIAFVRDGNEAFAHLFFVRGGKVNGRERLRLTISPEETDEKILSAVLMLFYENNPDIPPEIVVQTDIAEEEKSALLTFFIKKRNGDLKLTVPKRGDKKGLIMLALKDAQIALDRYGNQEEREKKKTIAALTQISVAVGFDRNFMRIEAYDISNTQGFESVGSMVVFAEGKPERKSYRKFKIKTVEGADDCASIEEVIGRRFRKLLHERNETKKTSFSKMPDALFIDGAAGQVEAAEKALKKLELYIPVFGMVKDDRHRTRALLYKQKEIIFPKTSEGFKLITRIQDEVHRFAIEYHRKLREKKMIKSELDNIKGVGNIRKKALLSSFNSVEEIKTASVEDLLSVTGMNKQVALSVYNYFLT
ncbi:MAG: excinuclease ABC subunit UvrC [Clostridiales bacterium]|jgi:excinuclease ABC subunit C|nr:excinuclease ABC subunit UvrC [Clostridiales bacterium]